MAFEHGSPDYEHVKILSPGSVSVQAKGSGEMNALYEEVKALHVSEDAHKTDVIDGLVVGLCLLKTLLGTEKWNTNLLLVTDAGSRVAAAGDLQTVSQYFIELSCHFTVMCVHSLVPPSYMHSRRGMHFDQKNSSFVKVPPRECSSSSSSSPSHPCCIERKRENGAEPRFGRQWDGHSHLHRVRTVSLPQETRHAGADPPSASRRSLISPLHIYRWRNSKALSTLGILRSPPRRLLTRLLS
jgi:hypothetical protein